MKNMLYLFVIALMPNLFLSCGTEPKENTKLSLSHFPDIPAEPAQNPSSEEGIALGKRLFFDVGLSPVGRACASCHVPAFAFSSNNVLDSQRDVLPLFNLAWRRSFFWDGGGKNLESAMFGPLRHPSETAANLKTLGIQLLKNPEYRTSFKSTFDTDTILPAHIARALAQYIRSLTSSNTQYDKYIQGQKNALNTHQIKGLAIFKRKCDACHTLPLAAADTFFALLPASACLSNLRADAPQLGRYRISGKLSDKWAYRPPSLRNLVYTHPYMHDGRFQTLHQVLNFYQKDSPFSKQKPYFDDIEKMQLYEFLISLTDSSFIVDK